MYRALKSNGILTTYACRTTIKNAMQTVGFQTMKLPGAPGKREMLRALKNG
jgi:tRNA U34 5-methylaminomethyl-2-thiouridine-forming methyltransferase MnmC